MGNSTRQIPWNEIGVEHARGLVALSDQLSRTLKDALAGVRAATLPDFDSPGWRYEFCIFSMFWFWYVANSPKFTRAGATKPLLDAYHRGCYQAFVEAKLIDHSEDDLRRWEDDLEARFLAYKDAYSGKFDVCSTFRVLTAQFVAFRGRFPSSSRSGLTSPDRHLHPARLSQEFSFHRVTLEARKPQPNTFRLRLRRPLILFLMAARQTMMYQSR